MTYEEAIDHIRCGGVHCLIDKEKNEELTRLIFQVLIKEIPEKPKVNYYQLFGCMHRFECCPNENEPHHTVFKGFSRCPLCGQAIDWSDSE